MLNLSGWLASFRIRVAGIAVLAAMVALFVFTPRFGVWRGLGLPKAWQFPELNRALVALQQLQHPLAPITNNSNLVIQWRLLFPLLGHALSLPPWIYLALPQLGCLLVLGYVAALMLRQGHESGSALAATVLFATCSWFFISTGWLAYFDAWYVLGMLLVAFSPSRATVIGAILTAPWVDERFVIALPLCLLVRDRQSAANAVQSSSRPRWDEWKWYGVALLPWLFLRLGFVLSNYDQVSAQYTWNQMAANPVRDHTRPIAYLKGLWEGLRWAWVLVLAWPFLEMRHHGRRLAGLVPAVVLVLTLGTVLAVADDLSRSVSIVVPVILLGLLLVRLHHPICLKPVLFGLCGLNLLFPAATIVGNYTYPIFYLYSSWELARVPPPELNAQVYREAGVALLNRNDAVRAYECFTLAIRIQADYAEAYSSRAVANISLGRPAAALADADHALALQPQLLDALWNRAGIRKQMGDLRGALADNEAALKVAPFDWSYRAQALRTILLLRIQLDLR